MSTISNGLVLGRSFPASTSGGNDELRAYAFVAGGQLYNCQIIQVDANNEPSVVVIRGSQLLLDVNIAFGYSSRLSAYSEADLSVLADSPDGNGFETPTGFVTPLGWSKNVVNGTTTFTRTGAISETDEDTNGDGIVDALDRSAPVGYYAKAVAWVTANKEISIVVGLALVYFLAIKKKAAGKGKGKSWLSNTLDF
jgi:hypothetical protein